MSDIDTRRLAEALGELGRNERLRAKMVALCLEAEKLLARRDLSVRDEITGPIVDALHQHADVLRKTLSDGTIFDFHYRSKIAREVVMSPDAVPDHVWEPQTTKLLTHLAEGARHVVIGGAYSGDQAILVARALVASNGVCHAFEPNPDQLAMLKRNAINNHLSNIRFNPVGLWNTANVALRLVGDDSFAHSEVVAPSDADAFPTTTIDAYGRDCGVDRLDLIMLDIEGAELAALEGARSYLSQAKGSAPNVVFEVHRHYVDWSRGLPNTDIARLMTGFGYALYAVRDYNSNVPMGGMPIEIIPVDRVYLEGPPHGFNMLAVKDAAILEAPIFRHCVDVSPKLLAHRDPALHHPLPIETPKRRAKAG